MAVCFFKLAMLSCNAGCAKDPTVLLYVSRCARRAACTFSCVLLSAHEQLHDVHSGSFQQVILNQAQVIRLNRAARDQTWRACISARD